jgi:threonine aldolase
LVALENSHNLAGGRITPPDRMAELIAVARAHGLPVHLDGARIHNSAAALGIPAAELAAGCDTVMFCLSKGLGAPVGSMLVGDADAIAEGRRIRKTFGGGMRQVGVIAAAALVALDEVLPTLGEDNRRARTLGDQLAEIPGIALDPATVETNIICFGFDDTVKLTAADLAEALKDEGVLVHALGHDFVRMVTHYHITDEDVVRAGDAVARVMRS